VTAGDRTRTQRVALTPPSRSWAAAEGPWCTCSQTADPRDRKGCHHPGLISGNKERTESQVCVEILMWTKLGTCCTLMTALIKNQQEYYINNIKLLVFHECQWTVPQLSIMIIYNSTWSILIQ